MKNFDLEAAKRGAAVCTRGGLPVEFSHITNSAYLPVRVLVYGDPKKLYSEIGAYLENGQMYPDIASEDDLMMRDDDYLESWSGESMTILLAPAKWSGQLLSKT